MSEIKFNKIIKMELMTDTPIVIIKGKATQAIKITTKSFWGHGEEKRSIFSPTNECNVRNDDKEYLNYYIYADETGQISDVGILKQIKYFLQIHQNNGNLKVPEEPKKE